MTKTRNGSKRMKLTKATDKDKEIVEVETGWGDLNYDVLEQIFRLLPVENLICSVSLVCRHWKLACGVVLFWKDYDTLDLSLLKNFGSPEENHLRYMYMHRALKSVLNWKTVEHHRRCIRNIIFVPCTYLKDTHLALIAERSPKLKNLILPAESYYITLKGITKIIQKWRQLEELSFGPLKHNCSDRFFQTLGICCNNLTRLHIFGSFSEGVKLSCPFFMLDENNASIITKYLRKLSVLSIDEARLHKFGVRTLLSEGKNLTELNLKRCCGIVDPPISPLIKTPTWKYLINEISVDITRNCLKWSIAS